uniref:Uncharacterized protein n=1 Tax=Anopheles arabiensis TaxID=7173 RepID=A0A182IHM5_ANOAR
RAVHTGVRVTFAALALAVCAAPPLFTDDDGTVRVRVFLKCFSGSRKSGPCLLRCWASEGK